MSKSKEAAQNVKEAAPPAALSREIAEDAFVKVETSRAWWRATKNQKPIVFVPRARSGDVSGLFKTKFKTSEPRETFVWICQAYQPIPASALAVYQGKEPVEIPADGFFLLIEPPILRSAFGKASQLGCAMRLAAIDKVATETALGELLLWRYQCDLVPTHRLPALAGPTAVEARLLLPAAAADVDEGEELPF